MLGPSVLHYRILEKIGEGGMGVVFKALDVRLNRTVAIKALLPIADPTRLHQFRWEARAAAGLRHPNIVVVHDIVTDEGADYIVMEYLPGCSLADVLTRERLAPARVMHYAIEIASAMEAAHNAGIVHRDLKPSNIQVTPEDTIKVLDFGLARLVRHEIERDCRENCISGTRGFMSPEQARGERATAQSDIYSFGAVLYEMATGERLPAPDERPGGAPLARECPPELAKIIEQCLRRAPRRRFQHMGDVRVALEDLGTPPQAWRWRIPAWWRRALLAGAFASMPLLTGWLLFGGHSRPEPNSVPVPLTSFPGSELSAAWSPDGRQVAFCWDGEKQDNDDIYVIQPGSNQTLRLTSEEGVDDEPSWSPDGRWIAYTHVSPSGDHAFVKLVSPLGGPSRTVISTAARLSGPKWTSDGRGLLVAVAPEVGRPLEVWVQWLDSGEHRALSFPPAGIVGDVQPALSPDGRTLAFCRKTGWRTTELFLQDLKPGLIPSGPPRQVTRFGFVSAPGWTADGQSILFGAHRDGFAAWLMDRAGGQLRPVFGVPSTASHPALGKRPDGHTSLVFTNRVDMSAIWRYPTEQGTVGSAAELAPSSLSQMYPHYSQDGKRLAFTSTRTGYQEIWATNADGSQPVQLTDLRHQLTEAGDWSPGNDVIEFVSQDRGQRQMYLADANGGPPRPLTSEVGVQSGTGWSRDGLWYYYNSMLTGRQEVRRVPRTGGASESVTPDGGKCGFEAGTGTFYYCQTSGEGTLMRRTAAGDREVRLSPKSCDYSFVPAPRGFYYRADGANDIYRYDETAGKSVRVVGRLPGPVLQFTVSPDGHWLAYSPSQVKSVDLMIIEKFHY